MTEKEKGKQGLLYNPNYDKALIQERNHAKDMCYQYNQIIPSHLEEREAVLKTLLGEIGEGFLIEQPFYCDYGYNIKIGSHFYANHNLVILDATEVKIGDYVFVGPNCGIYAAGHPTNIQERNEGLEYAKKVTIGNNVWIGGNVTIVPGVTIGDNVTIGAGSVVTKDIPSNCIAYGNPCKVRKEI